MVTEALEDTAHDAVLAAVYLDAHLALVVVVGILYGVSVYLAIFEGDAIGYLLHVVGGKVLVKIYVIDLLLQELRVSELAGELAIVGKEQHTHGVAVQATYGIDALRTGILDQIHNGLALLWIIDGGNVVLRFVKQYIDLFLDRDGLVMKLNLVGAENLGSQFGNDLTIDRYHTGLDKLVGLATRAYTGIGQKLVKAQGLVGVYVVFLVLDALLHAILSIGVVVGRALAETAAVGAIATALIAALLTRLIAALLTGLIATLLAGLIATLWTGTETTLLTGLETAFIVSGIVTGAKSTLLWTGLIVALLTGLEALALATVVIAGTVATLLTGLIGTGLTTMTIVATGLITTIIESGTETAWLSIAGRALEIGPKTLGAEPTLLSVVMIVAVRTGCTDTGALRSGACTGSLRRAKVFTGLTRTS